MKTIDAKQCTAIALGRLGENDYTVVRFDVSAWLNELPGAVIGLYNQRPGDNAAYPVAGITVDGGLATWTVTSAELTQTGEGKCELVAIAGEVVAKSAIFRTMVFDALDGSGEVPEPWEEWQQQFIILKGEAEQAADRAEEAVEHYPRIVDGVWEVWDAQAGVYVSTGVQAQGPQGIQGVPGPQGEPGAQGETGPQGEPGADGVTFTPAVSAEGVISWTNDGGKTNPQPVNIKGPKGDTGATGLQGEPGADYVLTDADKAEIAQQAEELLAPVLDTKAPAIWEDASGSIAHFADGAGDMPLRECVIQIEPVQEGTGDPSPENVRPITGWTGAKVRRTGKNLIDQATANKKGSNIYFGGGSGSSIPDGTLVLPEGIYTIKVSEVQSGIYATGISGNLATAYTKQTLTFTNPQRQAVRLMLYQSGAGIEYWDTINVQLELGSTATDYEPYQGETYDITFPAEAGTVYGGTLDVVTGELVVDRAEVDMGALTYTRIELPAPVAGYGYVFLANGFNMKENSTKCICSEYPYLGSYIPLKTHDKAIGYIYKRNICVRDDDYIDATNFANAMSGVQLVYELSTPITYTLTPQEIRTLLGTNNIWADTGDTAVTYPADTKKFVEQNTPESQVQDVQVNGTSVVTDGVANVPVASDGYYGLVKPTTTYGVTIVSNGYIGLRAATDAQLKAGTAAYAVTLPNRHNISTFYGLAKAAGDSTQSASSNAVGNYTESAKSAISTMLNGPVTVSGTTPSITALPGIQYICGEVSTLDITLPASGCIDVVFTSGSTATVLTITPPTGVTVKWANGFDPTALEANTTYEINIADGLGVAASWT